MDGSGLEGVRRSGGSGLVVAQSTLFSKHFMQIFGHILNEEKYCDKEAAWTSFSAVKDMKYSAFSSLRTTRTVHNSLLLRKGDAIN